MFLRSTLVREGDALEAQAELKEKRGDKTTGEDAAARPRPRSRPRGAPRGQAVLRQTPLLEYGLIRETVKATRGREGPAGEMRQKPYVCDARTESCRRRTASRCWKVLDKSVGPKQKRGVADKKFMGELGRGGHLKGGKERYP